MGEKGLAPRELLRSAAQRLDLPEDLVAGLARVEILGSDQLTIENHRGILRFDEQELEAAVPGGSITISGSGLFIRKMTGQELTVAGQLEQVRFSGGAE